MTKEERELLILLTELVMDVLPWENPQIRSSPAWGELMKKLAAIKEAAT
jgi:hypothetical protein